MSPGPTAPPETTPVPEPPPPQIIVQRTGIPEAIIAAFAALGYALSARLILFLSLVGAFVLGLLAMLRPSTMGLLVLIAYVSLTVLPMVWLELKAKRPRE